MNRYISKSYKTSKNTIDRQYTERGQLQCQLLQFNRLPHSQQIITPCRVSILASSFVRFTCYDSCITLVFRIFFLFLTPHLDQLKLTTGWQKYFLFFFIHFFILCDLFAMKLSYCCCWLSIIITTKRNKQHESKSTKTFKNHCLMKKFRFLRKFAINL